MDEITKLADYVTTHGVAGVLVVVVALMGFLFWTKRIIPGWILTDQAKAFEKQIAKLEQRILDLESEKEKIWDTVGELIDQISSSTDDLTERVDRTEQLATRAKARRLVAQSRYKRRRGDTQ